MKPEKSQYSIFITQALPTLFHKQTDEFIRYVEEKGEHFFQFWWEQAGKQAGSSDEAMIRQLRYQVDVLEKPKGKLIRLWLSGKDKSESFIWLAFFQRARRTFQWLPIPRTRVIGLGWKPSARETLELVDITPMLRLVGNKKIQPGISLKDGNLEEIAALFK